MKRPAHRRKSSEDTPNVLALTPELMRSAKDIVSIYDRIDWKQLEEADCDTVEIHFQSIEATKAASRIILEMVALDDDSRKEVIEKVEKAFRMVCPPLPPNEVEGKAPVPLSHTEADKLLRNLPAADDPFHFADLCIQASVLHQEIKANSLERHQSEGIVDGLPPLPPLERNAPSWLGSTAELWIGVPVRLVFAEPIVALCRRIAETNTGITQLSLKVGEEDSLRLHHRLWVDCKPRSYRTPVDDLSHPLCHELQGSLNDFFPKLWLVVSECCSQGGIGKLAAPKETHLTLIGFDSQTENNPNAHPSEGGTALVSNQEFSLHSHEPSQSGLRLTTLPTPVCIEVNPIMVVTVNGNRIANSIPARALLALAALAGAGKTELTVTSRRVDDARKTDSIITTREFVGLSRGNEAPYVSKRWSDDKQVLLDHGVKVDSSRKGVWSLGGFRIVFSGEVNQDRVREHLHTFKSRAL